MNYKLWTGRSSGRVTFAFSERDAAWHLVEWMRSGVPRDECHILRTCDNLVQSDPLTPVQNAAIMAAAAEFL